MLSSRVSRSILAGIVVMLGACDRDATTDGSGVSDHTGPAAYVGTAACASCHQEQQRSWQGSHHDLAMDIASETSVAGDFNDSEFLHQTVLTRFYKRDGQYFTETESADGTMQEFPVRYTFGTDPLQQYLVELPDGRIQVLGVAWDSRPEKQGGQRWFHVYGDDPIDFTDVLHWTRMSQNWDSMCADCHSTGLVKHFDVEAERFDTTWAEIDVACEACHGPGSHHVAWAQAGASAENNGLVVDLNERANISWLLDAETGNSSRSEPRVTEREITTCAPCHSRRSKISDASAPVDEFLDHYLPALPQPELYYADGQIRDEVYVYSSFLQSRMYQQGVTCSDCHDPHSLELRAPGSEVCMQCHAAETFATTDHHLHPVTSSGADCIGCHMPPTTYMQIDARHDHSFRVPRLELSAELALPEPCTKCHFDRDTAWAAAIVTAGHPTPGNPHWSETLARAQMGAAPGMNLLTMVMDESVPSIIRATAMVQSPALASTEGSAALVERAADSDPWLRWSAARVMQSVDAATRVRVGPQLLDDPVKAVRLAAMYALLPLGPEVLPPESQRQLDAVVWEYIDAQLVAAERGSSHTNIANLYRMLNRYDEAEGAYRTAIRLNPFFIPAYVNLVDLYRVRQQEPLGETTLREALEVLPDQAPLHHALGLLLVRQGRMDEALMELGIAADAAEATPRFALAYALAIDAQGRLDGAINYLNDARLRFPGDQALTAALLLMYERAGDADAVAELRRMINIPGESLDAPRND